ncbi:MAG: DNA repair protein RecO C-terminal domain-containing protein [Spirochaetaceae bacterium]|nr:DNA repair protein RecO C-terminal domain-containing protein [Spirochaetaceae bacterium]
MPSRNLVYEALALRARESPAGDRIVCLMTAEAGLQDVFVFGGPKSKLRSLGAPYSAGRAFVYLDPPRDFRKLTDFDVREPFSGLRESLRKLWAAGLVAEFLLKTSGGGGDFPEVLALALDTLRGLEAESEERSDYPTILFLWRMIALLGLMPDPGACSACGVELAPGAPRLHTPSVSGYLCPRCAERESERLACEPAGSRGYGNSYGGGYYGGGSRAGGAYGGPYGGGQAAERPGERDGGLVSISAGAARWLDRAESLPFAEALKVSLDAPSLAGLKRLAFDLARRAAETPLATLNAGGGIL